MKNPIVIYLSFLFIILIFTSCSKNIDQANVEVDIAAINELGDRYTRYAMARDIDNFMTCFADDATRAEPGFPPIIGKDAIRERFKIIWEDLADINLARYGDNKLEVYGDVAYGFGTYTLSSTPADGGTTVHIDMNVLTILKRQGDGSWKIYIDCMNYFPTWSQDTIPEELLQQNDPYY